MGQWQEEPPLTRRELRILRGMLDEYSYAQRRHAFWRGVFGTSRLLVAVAASLTVVTLNVVTLVLLLTRK